MGDRAGRRPAREIRRYGRLLRLHFPRSWPRRTGILFDREAGVGGRERARPERAYAAGCSLAAGLVRRRHSWPRMVCSERGACRSRRPRAVAPRRAATKPPPGARRQRRRDRAWRIAAGPGAKAMASTRPGAGRCGARVPAAGHAAGCGRRARRRFGLAGEPLAAS